MKSNFTYNLILMEVNTMETKKANMSIIIEMEAEAFKDLINSKSESKFEIENIKIKKDNVYYEAPEIQSISDVKISEINEDDHTSSGIEKRDFDNYTVGEIIDILSTFPKDYEFLCCGESDYSIWVDHNSGIVSIDETDFINNQIKKYC